MTKVTLIVELPDDLAARLNALPEAERSRRTAAALRALDVREQAAARRDRVRHDGRSPVPVQADELSADEANAIRQGLAELESGQEVVGDAVFANLFRRVGLRPDGRAPETR